MFKEFKAFVVPGRALVGAMLAISATGLAATQQRLSQQVRTDYVKVEAPVVALTHARLIDGTGGPVRENQTLVMRDGLIAAVGSAGSVPVPDGATVIDVTGKSVLPGLVMTHEHLYYPVGPGVYGQLGESFTRLYLAGGVTTMRTGGNVNGFMDLNLRRLVESGQKAGPAIDATAPYLNGPGLNIPAVKALRGAEDAKRMVAFWADEGFTSFKAYMHITRDVLSMATVKEVKGHLFDGMKNLGVIELMEMYH